MGKLGKTYKDSTGENSKKIVIGDVHGCYAELMDLLKLSRQDKEPREIYFVGDIINRGPDSKSCFEFLKKNKCKAVLGNHELEHLKIARGEKPASSRAIRLMSEFGESCYQEFLESISLWPLYLDNSDFLLVHAGIEPGKAHFECDEKTLTSIREYPDPVTGEPKPWFNFYSQKKLLLFGHWATLGGLIRPNLIGLDMGCVYGKKLRAVLLPERKIIEVPARRRYYDPFLKKSQLG